MCLWAKLAAWPRPLLPLRISLEDIFELFVTHRGCRHRNCFSALCKPCLKPTWSAQKDAIATCNKLSLSYPLHWKLSYDVQQRSFSRPSSSTCSNPQMWFLENTIFKHTTVVLENEMSVSSASRFWMMCNKALPNHDSSYNQRTQTAMCMQPFTFAICNKVSFLLLCYLKSLTCLVLKRPDLIMVWGRWVRSILWSLAE
jgi:hypothetical protein